MRTKEELARIYQRRARTVYLVAVSYGLQVVDCEDIVQETFIRLLRANPAFNDAEHEKAWLIVTAGNLCKNYLAKSERKNIPLEGWDGPVETGETGSGAYDSEQQMIHCIRQLPERLRLTVYLYYYESYNSREIADMLGIHSASVRRRLSEARRYLKELWKTYEK
ncbi:MAG: sigma-70 family RNA polymerase sigma factor [Eubacteriales bacterium]|nr:sigma-70 family RNA polymerase sigma factor [Eubacteriales bacterium]